MAWFARSAPRARRRYLDFTAQQSPLLALSERVDQAARDAGVAIVPGVGFYGGLGDLLASLTAPKSTARRRWRSRTVLYSDGGGKVTAARKPLVGAARIAGVMAALTRKELGRRSLEGRLVRVNGQPGRIQRTPDGTVRSVLSIDVVDGRIQAVRVMRNPEKLAHL